MPSLKLSAKDFPKISNLSSGDNVKLVLSGTVALRMLGDDDSITLDLSDLSQEKEESREHPSEIMKRMLSMQALQSTPIP